MEEKIYKLWWSGNGGVGGVRVMVNEKVVKVRKVKYSDESCVSF